MYKIAVIGPESTGKSALTQALARHYTSPYVDEYARDYVTNLGRPYTFNDVCEIAKIQVKAEEYIESVESFKQPSGLLSALLPASLSSTFVFPEQLQPGNQLKEETGFHKAARIHEETGTSEAANVHQGTGTPEAGIHQETGTIEKTGDLITSPLPPFVFFDTELIITKVWFQHCFGEVPDFVTHQLQKGFFDFYIVCDTDLPWEPDPVREHGDDREYFSNWYLREIEQLEKPYVIVQGTGSERLSNAVKAIKKMIQANNTESAKESITAKAPLKRKESALTKAYSGK